MAQLQPPVGVCILSAFGGALIFFEGLFAWVGALQLDFGYGATSFGTPPTVGPLGCLLGVFTIALAFALLLIPRSHTGLGIGLVTFALLSLFFGGGFFLGALFAYAGGVLAILVAPRAGPPVPAPSIESELDDPVVEADLVDSGLLPASPPESDPGNG